MKKFPLIVIGASAGGVNALRAIVQGFGQKLESPILIALHVGAYPSILPELLVSAGAPAAKHAENGEKICPRQIYIAPPDRHMVVENGCVRLTRGPKVNWARPAIDPLFQSAAVHYGTQAIGVILSGTLNDGTLGLQAIKRHGGISVVQDPNDAEYPGMPRSAAHNVEVDYCPKAADIPALLVRLSVELQRTTERLAQPPKEESLPMSNGEEFERPVALMCPDCGGALRRREIGNMVEYRCHIRHAYTAEVLCAAHFTRVEEALRTAERMLNERAELCRQMAASAISQGLTGELESWQAAQTQATDRALEVRDLVEREWTQPPIL